MGRCGIQPQAGRVDAPSADEFTQFSLLRLYSMWWCAYRAASMVFAIPEKISDGKAEMKRFNSIDLEGIADEALLQANKYKVKLQEALGSAVVTSSYSLMGSASPDYDPVTNDGA